MWIIASPEPFRCLRAQSRSEGVYNQFVLPSGEVITVYPVIEMASSADADDHHDLSWDEAEAFGIAFELYERTCTLEEDD
jgi:hypothetical protein